ncbi:hypothetical protein H6F42_15205 [Pseudanabaena sp. FACHB-1998]|uniref:hypothetical protein n=1 Tax=Pseudanabaena sp. FACHB-1998 TaxID=2692858 RepID=UPI0016813758|nr:hypothetical protein [Pseudanabaena sp. FACHB-1998]MBD2178264.1 hypothetical protein [Pseudanabaena sp. FACHB-1998]
MQVSPFHSQRQLVSGKVGWGWRQATYPISLNFGFAGFLMLIVATSLLMRIGDPLFLVIESCLLIGGLLIGLYTAKSVVDVCRQNSEYAFSQGQLIAIAGYFLTLIGLLSSFEILGENLAKPVIAVWWTLPAAIFTGLSFALLLRSNQSKSSSLDKKLKPQTPTETISADALNIVTYSDQTVLVSPSALGQQPRQFNSLVLMVLGFFFWTMLDFSASIRAIAAIAFATTGLTGFFTWQAQLRITDQILHLRFSGLWEMAAEYAIDLRQFSQLAVVKLQEANGELSWMQLSGNRSEITLPLAMTMLTSQTKEGESHNDQLGQILREEFHLAKQETERDSLGLANVLLPQGAGILAGTAFIAVGGLILFLFPLASKLSIASAIALLGVCIVSPAIARFFLQLVATNSLHRDQPRSSDKHLQPWEVGSALLLMSIFFATQNSSKFTSLFSFNQALPLVTLILGWLSLSIGVCILAFVRRTPLWNNNY